MVVYGDACHEEALPAAVAHLRTRLELLLQTSEEGIALLDSLRTLLILAGQLEQAAADTLPDHVPPDEAFGLIARIQSITDRAAAAFCACWSSLRESEPVQTNTTRQDPDPRSQAEIRNALAQMRDVLDSFPPLPDLSLPIKSPEGFTLCALYPEQYAAAIRLWLEEHPNAAPRCAAVVGIRSIGTALSAVVATMLSSAGWNVRRLTVRPEGHPYARTTEIAPEAIAGAVWGFVVDEGPGLSGSSMAAAAQALHCAGIARERLYFLPGHSGEPGHAADEEVRSWWTTTRRHVVPTQEMRWEGKRLPDLLAARTSEICGSLEPIAQVDDLGGGLWRQIVYSDPGDWPGACIAFERPKYRCTTRSGVSILWKFAGLAGRPGEAGNAAEAALRRQTQRAAAGWSPAPLGTLFGFVATSWIEGVPLTRADADPAVLASLGRYIAEAAGPPLSSTDQEQALERLREMLYWNTWEVLGETAAERTRKWSEQAAYHERSQSVPAYGDGRLAPYEWLRTRSGRLLKTDSVGHEADQTIVGRQPLAWDLAGAMVEWGLDLAQAAPLLTAFWENGGAISPLPILHFYCMAYDAFRMGQTSFCADMLGYDPDDQARLRRDSAYYRKELERRLNADPGRMDRRVAVSVSETYTPTSHL